MTTALSDDYRESQWPMPPRTENQDGQPRRLGVELEFSGIPLDRVVDLMRKHLGGEVQTVSPYELFLCDSSLGDFAVEL
ncbi:MAG: amidoligase family protein, partial [Haliea sp.]